MKELMDDIGSYVLAAVLAAPIVGFLIWYNTSAVNKAQERYLGQSALGLENKLKRKQFSVAEKREDGWYDMDGRDHILHPTLYGTHADAIESFCKDKQCDVKSARKSTPYLSVIQKMERIVWASVDGEVQLVFAEHLPQMGNK